jgi:hypothetical protein
MKFPRGYETLCNKVEEILPSAGRYLRYEAPHLPQFEPNSNLSSCFIWDDAPTRPQLLV